MAKPVPTTTSTNSDDPTPNDPNNLGDGSRVFNIVLSPSTGETQSVTFDSLTITGGDSADNGGGVRFFFKYCQL